MAKERTATLHVNAAQLATLQSAVQAEVHIHQDLLEEANDLLAMIEKADEALRKKRERKRKLPPAVSPLPTREAS